MAQMNQLEMELKFSKKGKDFITIDSFVNDAGKLMSTLHATISSWIEEAPATLYPEMLELSTRLPEPQDIVIELMLTIVTKHTRQQIQGIAIELGSRLGYHDTVEAAKIGSSLIAICHGELYDIDLQPEATYIIPKLVVDQDTHRKLQQLNYLPPNIVPAIYTSNYGGWLWERKSCILGSNNHHNEYQALDVLNKLQQIPWTLDTEVLVSETHEKLSHNEAEILGHYVGETFYFTWRYDKRGRLYSSGYNINPQGDEYSKALLTPTHAEICNKNGMNALAIDIANYAGKDKLTWEERIDFVANADLDNIKWKKPILGRKAVRAYKKALKGEPVSHFVELDATSSGTQIMAALSGCMQTAKLCNLVNTGKRENLYDHIQQEMAKQTDMTGVNCKYPIMTHFFGSRKVPRETFTTKQLEVFYDVISNCLPGCDAVMAQLAKCWNPYTLEHSWTLPDGHICKVKVMEREELRISVAELDGRQFTLAYKKNRPSTDGISILGNVIHSIDGYVCREIIRRCNFEVSCIHDCWQCHPNNAEILKQTYREILSEIASSTLLNDICSEIIGKDAGIRIKDEGLADAILQSSYALS